jgi:hypothetical protein
MPNHLAIHSSIPNLLGAHFTLGFKPDFRVWKKKRHIAFSPP